MDWKKRLIVIFLGVLLIIPALFGCSKPQEEPKQTLPDNFWNLVDEYGAVYEAGDDEKSYEIGKQLIEIMESQPDSEFKTEFLAGKYEHFMRLTERLGKFDESLTYIDKYIPYGEAMGWTEGVIYAKRKRNIMLPELQVFTEKKGEPRLYYGAKFEPKDGCYFGSTYDNDPRINNYEPERVHQYFPKSNSVYLIYLEFGDELTEERYQHHLQSAKEEGAAVLLAWNTYTSMDDIMHHQDYIQKTIKQLGDSGLPIFLRFANEMNIGPNGDDPEAYVKAFRYVAEQAHTEENIAMVWSPNDVSALDRPFEEYYPGDDYVDWVGVSSYIIRYFAGVADHGEQTDSLSTYFYTGEYGNPIVRLREITNFMTEQKIEKPLMITEGAVPHYLNESDEDITDWALIQLQRYYGELVREYPQLKSICYFNVHIEEEPNDYALHRNEKMNALYNEMVADDYYLSEFGGEAGYSYQPFEGSVTGEQKLSAVAYYPKALNLTVKYYLDGREIYSGSDSPYEFLFDTKAYSEGKHTFTVKLFTDRGEVLSKDSTIDIRHSA